MAYIFAAQVAWSANTSSVVKNVVFQAYATTDTGFTTPLAILDANGAAIPGNTLNSGAQGVFPEFQQADHNTVVITDASHVYVWTIACIPSDASTAAFINDPTSATSAAVKSLTAGTSAALAIVFGG